MATASIEMEQTYSFENIRHFPSVINGRINIVNFLEATTDLVVLVESLGKVFTPVKYDMQGNIDKIKKVYEYDENSCLLELILTESSKGKLVGAEGVLWLNRALLFFELIFKEILQCLQTESSEVSMKKIFTVAYEGSVKKYHNWITQQVFVLICRMSPSLPHIIKSFQVDNDIKLFERRLTSFNITLHIVRCKIDDFFKDYNMFKDPQ